MSKPETFRALMERVRQGAQARLTHDEHRLPKLRQAGKEWSEIAADYRGSPEALRKKLARAVARLAREIGLDEFTDG